MAQMLTVCRIGAEWGFRDVTGAEYGHSTDIRGALDAAESMARRIGSHVNFSPEAEDHYRSIASGVAQVDEQPPPEMYSRSIFRTFLARWWGK